MCVCVISTGPPPSALHSGAWRSCSTIVSHSASPSSPSIFTSAPRIEHAREATAGIDDLVVPPREPGADPVRALVEGEGRPAVAADAPADHEAAGIDEAHVLEHAAGGGHAHGEWAQPRHRDGSCRLDTRELRAERCSGGGDETIAAAPILLAGEAEYPPAREPARARVERPRHTLAGRPDAEGETERGVGALRDDPLHLIGQAQDHHALAVPTHRVEER